jgi:hypothetical protein
MLREGQEVDPVANQRRVRYMRRIRQDGALGLQIATSEVLRREVEWPVSSGNRRFAIYLHGSVEVDGSANVLGL